MGKEDSSQTIAHPLITKYLFKNVYDDDGLCELLNNFMSQGIRTERLDGIGEIQRIRYKDEQLGITEMSLHPTFERLKYLLEEAPKYLTEEKILKSKVSENTKVKRMRLIGNESDRVIKEAISVLEKNYKKNSWPRQDAWVKLEGITYPDIFIETDQYVLVGEVKNTERSLTKSATYDATRVQLVRHIEGALNYIKSNPSDNREVISFYILSQRFVGVKGNYEDLRQSADRDSKLWDLPHLLTEEVKEKVNNTYMGYAIWEDIQKRLNK